MSQVLTLNASGQPLHWASWQEAVIYKAKDLVLWESGEQEFTKFGGSSRLTGEQSSVTFSTIMAVKGNHFPKRTIPVLNNTNLFGRDLNMCAYCGNTSSPHKLTRDHIVPRSKGGPNTWMNVVTACRGCNGAKGDKSLESLSMQLLYVPYVPCREEALILKNRHILIDQMSFLQKMLPKHSRLLVA